MNNLKLLNQIVKKAYLCQDDWKRITELSESEDLEIRLQISQFLAQHPCEQSELILLKLAHDRSYLVRANAFDSLSFSHSEKTLFIVKKALRDRSRLVRGYAALSIADIQKNIGGACDDTLDALVNCLEKEKSDWVKIALYRGLFLLGCYSYGQQLLEAINSKYYQNRCFALELLAQLKEEHLTDRFNDLESMLKKRLEIEKSVAVRYKLKKMVSDINL